MNVTKIEFLENDKIRFWNSTGEIISKYASFENGICYVTLGESTCKATNDMCASDDLNELSGTHYLHTEYEYEYSYIRFIAELLMGCFISQNDSDVKNTVNQFEHHLGFPVTGIQIDVAGAPITITIDDATAYLSQDHMQKAETMHQICAKWEDKVDIHNPEMELDYGITMP